MNLVEITMGKAGYLKKFFLICLSTVALSGCYFYTPPDSFAPQSTAIMVGSKVPDPAGGEIRVAAAWIDGSARFAAIYHYDQPFLIPARSHKIDFQVFRFLNGSAVAYGERTIAVNLPAGGTYTIHATVPVPLLNQDGTPSSVFRASTVWIDDQNGVEISKKSKILFKPPVTFYNF